MLKNNILIHDDNLNGLNYLLNEKHLKSKIDLVYIDPPFATGNIFKISNNKSSSISYEKDSNVAYSDIFNRTEFLNFLEKRLILIRELLSDCGSIYLHTDYKIGHYVKILMDEIFGIENFRNDISRVKSNPKNFKRIGYGNIKDSILFYTKTSNPIWNEPYLPYTKDELKKSYPKIKNGRYYTTSPIHAPGETSSGATSGMFKGMYPPAGRHWVTNIAQLEEWDKKGLIEWSKNGNPRKIMYADEHKGKRVQDIWTFKDSQKLEYPTQKNINILDLIIKTSSNTNSIVLDCFCGSGTTLEAAELNGRKWIGIDQSDEAMKVIENRITSNYVKK